MRGITIPKRGYGRGKKCAECRRVIRPGDCGFVHRTSQGYKDFWWHRVCLEEIMNLAPLDAEDYLAEYNRLREAAAEGQIFE